MPSFRSLLMPVLAVSATVLALWYFHLPAPIQDSNKGQVRREAEKGGYRLIDAETLSRLYRSKRDKILLVDTRKEWEHRAGHIHGSVNFPLEPTGWARWRQRGALKAILGPDKEKTMVFY